MASQRKKTLYYYALVLASPHGGEAPLAVAEMVTNSHTMTSLANFLAQFRHCEAKIFGYRSVSKPLRMESDFSWPFVLATLKEFNGESLSEFLERAWRMATKSCLQRDSNMVNPHTCSSHVMHDISLQCKERGECAGRASPSSRLNK